MFWSRPLAKTGSAMLTPSSLEADFHSVGKCFSCVSCVLQCPCSSLLISIQHWPRFFCSQKITEHEKTALCKEPFLSLGVLKNTSGIVLHCIFQKYRSKNQCCSGKMDSFKEARFNFHDAQFAKRQKKINKILGLNASITNVFCYFKMDF